MSNKFHRPRQLVVHVFSGCCTNSRSNTYSLLNMCCLKIMSHGCFSIISETVSNKFVWSRQLVVHVFSGCCTNSRSNTYSLENMCYLKISNSLPREIWKVLQNEISKKTEMACQKSMTIWVL